MKRISISLACVFLSFCLFAQDAADSVYKPVQYPEGWRAQLNLVYTRVGNWEGKMDLYTPPPGGKPSAVVINIHGGGWNHGVKESQTGFNSFFKESFAVANIEYRLTPFATAPAAVEDARCALIYLVKNAEALNIDLNRIVVMGGSSGGHLALMTGYLENDPIYDSQCPGAKKIKVAAVIDKYGITDVWDWAYGKDLTSKSATNWLGAKKNDSIFARSLSPLYYVKKTTPPTFIVHGDADPTVPYQQSVALYKKLQEAGVTSAFMTVPGGLHGKFDKEKNSELNKAIMQFIKNLPAFK